MRRSGLGGGGNYPPGAKNDPRAPYNQSPAPECDICGGVYADDGHLPIEDAPQFCYDCGHHGFETGDWDTDLGCEVCPNCGSEDIDHEPCPNDGMNRADYEDAQQSAAAEQRFDAMRDDGEL